MLLRTIKQLIKTSIKAELEEREKHVHELEVFYKANIGRKERVLELKEKIEELEGKLKGK